MVLITLNIPDDLREKLKHQANQSALVSELLRNYFNCHGTRTDIEKQLAELENKDKLRVEVLEKERQKLERELSLKERTEREQEEFQKKEKERAERQAKYDEENKPLPKFDIKAYATQNPVKIRESVNRGFKHFMGRDMLQEEYDIYMKDYWADGRPMTEFIEVAIKNQKPNDGKNTESEQIGSTQTEKPYESA